MSFDGIALYVGRALAFAVPVGAVWAAVYLLRRRGQAFDRRGFWLGLLFAVYLAALIQITVIRSWRALPGSLCAAHTLSSVQPIPFQTMLETLFESPWQFCYNVIGNLVWFVPLGLLGAAAYPKLRRWRALLASSASLSLAIELLQWCFGTGISDIDDILLNTLGAVLGLLLWKLAGRIRKRQR